MLLGWFTHNELLIQLHPAFVPMQFNTATAFLCCGLMLLAHCHGLSRTLIVLAAIVASIGSLTLAEYLFAVDLGIDQLVLKHYILVQTSHPGRMAANTALAFLLTSVAVLLSRAGLPKRVALIYGIFGSLVLGLGISALLGYGLQLESAYGWGRLTRMAVHTAFGFSVLGLGLTGIAWNMNRATSKNLPKWLPVPIALTVITVTLSVWQALSPERDLSGIQDARNLVLVLGMALAAALSVAVVRMTSETAARHRLEQEVAERIDVEKKLRQSEQRMKLVLQGANLGTWDWNVKTGEVIFNEHLAQMLGYEPEEFAPDLDSWAKAVHPDDWPRVQEALKPHLEGKTASYETEHRVQHKSGDWVWILDKGAVIERDSDGKALRMCGTHLDITSRKQADAVLQQYEHIVASSTDMLAFLDTNYVYLATNPVYLEAFGKSSDELIGHTARELFGDDLFINRIQPNADACLGGKNIRFRDWFEFPKHGRRFMDIIYSAYRGPDNKIQGFVVSGRDITDYQKLQEQLLQSQKMESVGQLAGGLAHDFNNMLGVIVGNAELAMETLDPAEPAYSDLAEIYKAARRSADLTEQLLAFARKQPMKPVVLKLNETVERMLKMLRRLIGENIHLNWQPGIQLWPIKMDPSQIDQIITNLCVNARDAIKDVGEISIETRNVHIDAAYCRDHPVLEPGDFVQFTVSDNGSGMEPKVVARVFEPFFTTKRVGDGTGLGLSMVYGIVKQNSGFIDVKSTAGHGATFDIYLPRQAEMDAAISHEAWEQAVPSGDATILVLDDEPAILRLTTTMLERLGYTVLPASSPDAAISLAQKHKDQIHLLLTDIIMPMMNGRDLARKLLTFVPDIKQLFMSGYTADVMTEKGALEEDMLFLQKPFTRKSLAIKVQQALAGTA